MQAGVPKSSVCSKRNGKRTFLRFYEKYDIRPTIFIFQYFRVFKMLAVKSRRQRNQLHSISPKKSAVYYHNKRHINSVFLFFSGGDLPPCFLNSVFLFFLRRRPAALFLFTIYQKSAD